jgi:hypothetical protein
MSGGMAMGGMGMSGGMGMGGKGMSGYTTGMGSMHSMGIGPQVGARSFAAVPMSRAAVAPQFSRAALAPQFSRPALTPHISRVAFVPHHPFFHHRFNRFVGGYGGGGYYASYDDCWRQAWTRFGLQWVNICGYYNYGY